MPGSHSTQGSPSGETVLFAVAVHATQKALSAATKAQELAGDGGGGGSAGVAQSSQPTWGTRRTAASDTVAPNMLVNE